MREDKRLPKYYYVLCEQARVICLYGSPFAKREIKSVIGHLYEKANHKINPSSAKRRANS